MNHSEIARRVANVLRVILQEELAEGVNLSRRTSEAWDSLKHIEVMFAIEEEFGLEFSESELAELDSLESIASAIAARS